MRDEQAQQQRVPRGTQDGGHGDAREDPAPAHDLAVEAVGQHVGRPQGGEERPQPGHDEGSQVEAHRMVPHRAARIGTQQYPDGNGNEQQDIADGIRGADEVDHQAGRAVDGHHEEELPDDGR